MRAQEVALVQPLLDYLAGRNDLRLLGPAQATARAPTFAIDLHRDPDPVALALAQHDINCWSGNFYAPRPLRAVGVDPDVGVLRLSLTHYTSAQEVDRLIRALDAVL